MHPELTAAPAPVLTDLEVPSGILPIPRDEEWQDHPGAASCWLFTADGSGAGVWISTGTPFASQVAMLAGQVQEWAVEALWGVDRWPVRDQRASLIGALLGVEGGDP